MLLTEDEARKETCPFIRYCMNEVGVLQDREAPIYANQLCQASDCKIAWRWEFGLVDADFAEVDQVPRGYCGIAGKVGGWP